MKKTLTPKILLLTAFTLTSVSATAQSIYTDTFSGDGTTLNGATTTTGGGIWEANTIANRDGTMGSGEGSALLEFNPVVDTQYLLSMDLTKSDANSDWVGFGFTSNAINPLTLGLDDSNERFDKATDGIAWMLYRDAGTEDTADDVQIFAGLSTDNPIADTGVYSSGMNTLSILIDTTGDGSSFTADFFINGISISSGAQTISLSVADINYVGFTSADDRATNIDTYVDNFSLVQIPEMETASLLLGTIGLLTCLMVRRRI
jgi:hypothetical protein